MTNSYQGRSRVSWFLINYQGHCLQVYNKPKKWLNLSNCEQYIILFATMLCNGVISLKSWLLIICGVLLVTEDTQVCGDYKLSSFEENVDNFSSVEIVLVLDSFTNQYWRSLWILFRVCAYGNAIHYHVAPQTKVRTCEIGSIFRETISRWPCSDW